MAEWLDVPLLKPEDPLPGRPRRILIAGVSGSGKTTLAARIAAATDIPHIEIDGLYHGPDWTPRSEFVADVAAFTAKPSWVTEWQYSIPRPLLLERCDLMVWLDLPTPVTMAQVVRRTLRRRWRRQELWNGNLEPPLHTIMRDPEHIIRWAWRTRNKHRQLVAEAVIARPELPIVHLRTHRESTRWLQGRRVTCEAG